MPRRRTRAFTSILKPAATAAAEATTRKPTAAAEAGASRAARSGSHGGTGERRHRVQATDKHIGVETWTEVALIPLRGLGINVLEGVAPVLLNAERHGKGQKLLKHFRRFDRAIEAVGLHVIQEILETQNALESARANLRVCGHEPAKAADDGAGENAGD